MTTSRVDLLPAIALHIALGGILLTLAWAAGYGVILALTRGRGATAPQLRALGYAAGVCIAMLVATCALAQPLLGVVALALPAWGIAQLLRLRSRGIFSSVKPALTGALLASPFVILFTTVLGLYYHGPTATQGSSARGDMLFYIAKLRSAEASIFPYRDLLVSGQHFTFTEAAPTFSGAALSWLPGFDPFLFNAVTLPAIFCLATAAGIGSLAVRPLAVAFPWRLSIPVAVLGASAIAYPSWLVESPPVTLAMPLAFGVYWLATERLTVSAFVLQAGLIAAALASTKVFALVFLAGVIVYRVAHRDLDADDSRRRTAVTVGAAVTLGVAFFVVAVLDSGGFLPLLTRLRFVPLVAIREFSQQLRDGLHIPWTALTVIGHVLALVALVRARRYALALGFAFAVLEHWVQSGVVDLSALGIGLFGLVFVYLLDPEELGRQRLLATATASCLGLAAVGREYTGTYLGPVLILSLCALVLASSRLALRLSPRSAFAHDAPLFLAFVSAAAILVGGHHASLVAVAWLALFVGRWALRRLLVGSTRRVASVSATVLVVAGSLTYAAARATLPPETGAITPDEYHLWRTVERLVPPTGLVFTSATGTSVTQQTGWNYYPAWSQRQLYIAGWIDGPIQRSRRLLGERLASNTSVLNGAPPAAADTTHEFGSYYATVSATAHVPATFHRLWQNDSYALYRIATT